MKTNYLKVSNILRVSILSLSLLLASSAMVAETLTKTIVFVDDFNRAEITPGGVPELSYNITKTGTATPIIESNVLKLPNISGETARTQLMASLTSYNTPFNVKLESINADSVVWTFNIRQNYNGRLTGIDDAASRGVAAVLVASSTDLSTANGYAIVNGGASPINYRLVKFTNGLTTASNITVVQEGQTLSDNRVYMSIKVVFIPSSKTWKIYDRIDGAASGGSFADPTDETAPYTFAGAIVDETHTNVTMSAFGFTHKYSGSTAFNFWIDNYQVTTSKTDLGTGFSSLINAKPYNVQAITNGLNVTITNANVLLYNALGRKISEKNINGSDDFRGLKQGVYFLKIEMDNKFYSSKVIVR